MMRIAIAGGGGLGYLLASGFASASNAYNVVVLSRTERPEFAQLDVQVYAVDYEDYQSLSFALQGIDLVISTISGQEQVNLINAAGHGRIRHFVPSEFEGSIRSRPSIDPLDRGSSHALALLKHWSRTSRMQYTVFSCGILMERFYGLGALNMGFGTGVAQIGDYLVDVNKNTAAYAATNSRGSHVLVCLTSVHDLVKYVVAAVDMGLANWPHEWTLCGDRMSIQDIVGACSLALNAAFTHQAYQYAELVPTIQYYAQMGDYDQVAYYQRVLATADGRYDFRRASLNDAVRASNSVDVRPLTFREWLLTIWG